jgi:GR25 family glycosyltransferase involved in LPS biosynthesis
MNNTFLEKILPTMRDLRLAKVPKYRLRNYPDVYMIRMSDNEKSVAWTEEVKQSWLDNGIELKYFEAIQPKDFDRYNNEPGHKVWWGLQGHKNAMSPGTKARPFTDTEKAVWMTQYELWKMCVKTGRAYIFAEHDVFCRYKPELDLLQRSEMVLLSEWRINTWTRVQPCGAYYITPPIARMLLELCPSPIEYNVDYWVLKVAENVGWFDLGHCYSEKPQRGSAALANSTIDHRVDPIDEMFLNFK